MSDIHIARKNLLESKQYKSGNRFDMANYARKNKYSLTMIRQLMRDMNKDGLVEKVDGDYWRKLNHAKKLLFKPLVNQAALKEIQMEEESLLHA